MTGGFGGVAPTEVFGVSGAEAAGRTGLSAYAAASSVFACLHLHEFARVMSPQWQWQDQFHLVVYAGSLCAMMGFSLAWYFWHALADADFRWVLWAAGMVRYVEMNRFVVYGGWQSQWMGFGAWRLLCAAHHVGYVVWANPTREQQISMMGVHFIGALFQLFEEGVPSRQTAASGSDSVVVVGSILFLVAMALWDHDSRRRETTRTAHVDAQLAETQGELQQSRLVAEDLRLLHHEMSSVDWELLKTPDGSRRIPAYLRTLTSNFTVGRGVLSGEYEVRNVCRTLDQLRQDAQDLFDMLGYATGFQPR